ncbi:MAG: phenylalanine--tRNA ligase subunit beta [candidate division WOR-3 bacterium]
MPVIGLPTDLLQRLIGKRVEREELLSALERLGSDVEGYAVLSRYRCERCDHLTEALEHEDFNNRCEECGSERLVVSGWSEVVRINLLPVRPDLFDAAGLARALKGFWGIESGLPEFHFRDSGYRCRVRAGMEAIRPHIVCCVARELRLDEELVKLLMKLQENLHWALGRDRRRASIGVYDLGTVRPDFEFRPVAPDGVRFVPLGGMPEGSRQEATPQEILEGHPKGLAYRHLLTGLDNYPLLVDSRGRVLSMPPIINSNETRVTEKTRELFVDVTGPDKYAITKILSIIAAALSDLGARVETVTIEFPDGRTEKTPDMSPTVMSLDPERTNAVLGVKLTPEEIAGLLARMRESARVEDSRVLVQVPAFRADIMHQQDLIEDVAIAYGYHRIEPRLVPTMTIGRPQPIEELSELCRRALTGLGFLETMSLELTSPQEHFSKLSLPDSTPCVVVENPATAEQTILRRHLFSGLLGTFRTNTTAPMPQNIFEIGDCFELDESQETGVRTLRRVAIGSAGPRAGFADIRSVVETLARELDLVLRFEPDERPFFIPGRAAKVSRQLTDGRWQEWTVLGEVHPQVLEAFGITQPVVLAECDLTQLVAHSS